MIKFGHQVNNNIILISIIIFISPVIQLCTVLNSDLYTNNIVYIYIYISITIHSWKLNKLVKRQEKGGLDNKEYKNAHINGDGQVVEIN